MDENQNENNGRPQETTGLGKKVKKAPQVRQTLTSKYRMLKANPLLMHELGKKLSNNELNKDFIKPLKSLATAMNDSTILNSTIEANKTILQSFPESYRPSLAPSLYKHSSQSLDELNRRKMMRKPLPPKLNNIASTSMPSVSNKKAVLNCAVTKKSQSNLNLKTQPLITNKKNTAHNVCPQKLQPAKPSTKINTSNLHLKKSSVPPVTNKRVTVQKQSNQNAEKLQLTKQVTVTLGPKTPKPITFKKSLHTLEESRSETPQVQYFTPITPNSTTRNVFLKNNPTPQTRRHSETDSKEMLERLRQWLKRRGTNVGDYHHLKCFGVGAPNEMKDVLCEAEKENVEANAESGSYEDLKIEVAEDNVDNTKDLANIAKDALLDLYKLILEGYPAEQCQIWLKLIKQKYRQLEEEPEYWECRAAIEQSRGNINLAVECYQTAIVQGAEVQNVDKHLDQLLQKFSLLNIGQEPDSRSKIVHEARQIFKSNIIQFAVQEKITKRRNNDGISIEKKIFATPVRRSTRRSRSAFTSTPGIHIYSSLQEIDTEIRNTLNFQCNKALKD